MPATKTTDHQNAVFEVKEKTDESIIFQRIIKQKGRSDKELRKIVDSLPTATMHTFSMEEYNRLKQIEQQIIEKFLSKESKKNSSLKDLIISFFEI